MKKYISLIMALLMTVMSLQIGFMPAYALTSGDWEYTLREDNTAEITGYTGAEIEAVIPDEIDGYTVAAIATQAFSGCESVSKLTIPAAVNSVGEEVFLGCSSLKEIKFKGTLNQWCNADIADNAIPSGLVINCNGAPSLQTKNTENGISISWSEETGAEGYYVYRKNASDEFKVIKTASGTNYTDTDVNTGAEYTYAVRAYAIMSGGSYEVRSSYNSSTVLRLSNPALKLTNTASGIKINWNIIPGADAYHLYKKVASGDYSKIATLSSNSYEDKNVTAGSKYSYAVYAVKGSSYKSACTPASVLRLISPAVSLANANDGIKISWKKIASAKTYEIYRKDSGNSYKKIANVSSLSYTDKSAKSGTTYRYAVYAFNGTSKSVCKPVSLIRLSNPSVKLSNVDRGVSVTWNKVTGAKGYYIYRKTSSGSYSVIGRTTSSSYVDETAKNKTGYYYAVRAYNGSVRSAYTAVGITFKIYQNKKPAAKGSFYYGVSYRSHTAKTCDVFKHGRNLILVNKEWELPENFKWDLVYWSNGKPVDAMSLNSKKYDSVKAVDRAAYSPLKRMFADAKKAGVPLVMVSAYRSISLQDRLFTRSVNSYLSQGYSKSYAIKKANYSRTFTGTSEHNIGLGFDITAGGGLSQSFENTAQYKWLQKNAANYGFILRYPKNKTSVTGIMFEPWHYRYVGVEAAKEMNKKGMCLEEYIDYLDKKQ
ncbi:MAG: D-alanyl-D-alanine carboxypeptidase family protein [Clostridiales bacterium]|nr:D-alanyl-D-alanine carboxypeptidase family protein [Clostridiales bacterium]